MSRNSEIRRSMLTELLEGQQPACKRRKLNNAAPVSTLLLDGQRALEDRRYIDAISLFSDAITNINDRKADLLHLYDLRATTYMRVENLDAALKDAKQMIRLDREDHRGYLKCAQVERRRANLKAAIGVCQYGLKSISQTNKLRQSLGTYLLRLREAEKSQIIFEKSTDPMEVLPSELLELVLLNFNYREATAIMRVCKAWRDRLRATDLLTQSIDTSSTRKTLKHEHIKTAFNRLGKNPKKLHLSRFNENAAYFVSSQLKSWFRWESIRSLTVDDAKVVIPALRYDKFVKLQEICYRNLRFRIRDVNDVLQNCPSLEHATFLCDFGNTPLGSQEQYLRPIKGENLRSLKLGWVHTSAQAQDAPFFGLTIDNAKPISANLEHLELENASVHNVLDLTLYTNLTSLALRETRFDNLKIPPTIENLLWHASHRILTPTNADTEIPASKMRALDLCGNHSIRVIRHLIKQGLSRAHLRRVSLVTFVPPHMVGFGQQDLDFLTRVPGREELSNVEYLTLRDDNVRDDEGPVIFSLFPNVRHLELESSSITEQIVASHIKSKDSVLRSIVFRNCPSVSQDFYEWARARHVDVEHVRQGSISASFANGGRRTRYE